MVMDNQYEEGMISIIIPVFNVEPYLRKCLDSVIHQTYQNLDIIIVDDGSTDHSGQICDDYQKIDSRVRVFHKRNAGLSSARNLGLRYVKGEFIGFVDSDDYIDKDMYESMLHEMKDDVDIVICGRRISFPKEMHQKSKVAFCVPKCIKMDNATAMERFLQNKNISMAVCDKVYRSSLLKGVSFPYKRVCEDIPVTYKLIAKSRNIVHLGKPKYNNFHRNGSISRQEFYYRQIDYAVFAGQICKAVAIEYPQLLMQAEALYIMCALVTLQKIQACQNRSLYTDMKKRIIKAFCHMYLRILRNPYILSEKKKKILQYVLEGNEKW